MSPARCSATSGHRPLGCTRTMPPIPLASYANPVGFQDSRETLHGPPPCTVKLTPAPHFGLTPRPVPAHNAPKVLNIPGKAWEIPGSPPARNLLLVFPPFRDVTLGLGLPGTCCHCAAPVHRPLDFRTASASPVCADPSAPLPSTAQDTVSPEH